MSNELVSVVVVSYNSSKYIIECLDSISNQIYRKLELIVTDDCSTDSTIDIAQEWIDAHIDRFERAIIVKTARNVGVSGNCNRGLREVKGTWVKMIAGDDMLSDNCISTCLQYIHETNSNAVAIVSDAYQLVDSQMYYMRTNYSKCLFGNTSAEKQCKILSKRNMIIAPSAFLHSETVRKIGGWNEDIPLCEDVPMWINLTSKGYFISYLQQPLVIYRKTPDSLVQTYKLSVKKRTINQLILITQYKIKYNRGWFKLNFTLQCKLLEYLYNKPSLGIIDTMLFRIYKLWYNLLTIPYLLLYSIL